MTGLVGSVSLPSNHTPLHQHHLAETTPLLTPACPCLETSS
eukprot:CAMPEP_0175857502 /NCGR_PEP_ID=MMETSP0107_2-20121207/29132_1 /TAXON_ID=195067 ORGANISM="Goniomonas pacifica, Strain CCMP1869" /NCGR_SAMPLE_ID=MMETSP0107_2 /ASSEMBLY_ACC=CAM_ASM_000203 /LENGTH=40 /DNA_ID= /DNA_START= /DNA_END= /DNA_ORIENTATION=